MYGQLCTEFYDLDKKFAPAEEVNFYKQIFNKNDLLLEPMCGSGRLLIPLLQEGYTVHGVDNSAAMLDSCRQRAANLGLHPLLFAGQVEDISLSNQYKGIVIPLGSFQLLYPRSIALHSLQIFKKHLETKGQLILDLFIPWEKLGEHAEKEFSEREIKTHDAGSIKLESHATVNKFSQYYKSENVYSKIVDNKIIAKEIEEMHVCWYYQYEMEFILEKYGFKNIKCIKRLLNGSNYLTFIAENYS